MAQAEVVGSWFPTGYHGHLRSRPRSDFICEFRKLARPLPPKKFIVRSQVRPTEHVFSVHDNKNSFLNDALYFEQGVGRRRDPKRSYNYNPNFISWVPPGRTMDDYSNSNQPLASTYRLNFQYGGPGHPVPQIMVKRPATSFEGVATTSYRYGHSCGQHSKEILDAMKNAAILAGNSQKLPRAKKSRPDSVASCMTWHVPEPPKQTRIPAATQTTDYTQGLTSTGSSSQTALAPAVTEPIKWPHPPTATETQ